MRELRPKSVVDMDRQAGRSLRSELSYRQETKIEYLVKIK